jgi:hypothetical protein
MVKQELVDYFIQYSGQYSINQMKESLVKQGYNALEVEEAAKVAVEKEGAGAKIPLPPGDGNDTGKDDFSSFFTVDARTKDTIFASILGLLIAELVVFFGDFLIVSSSIYYVFFTIAYAVIGGAIAGFLLSKLYEPIMDFISKNLRFLLPLTNTFFKFLFFPVVIGSLFSLLLGLAAGSAAFLIGSKAGVDGGILGAFIGSMLILVIVWSILVSLAARFIYAKFMVFKVGRYYKDYK